MAIETDTKDCTALSDDEMAELVELSAEGDSAYPLELFEKAKEDWVLVSLARWNGKLWGFSFSTLERIGGTPSVVLGPAVIKRSAKRDTVLRSMVTEQLRRAVLAFPDEDVFVGARFTTVSGYDAFFSLEDIVPRPDYTATGEERAWGRRLARRWGIEGSAYDEHSFVVTGDGSYPEALDHETLRTERIEPGFEQFFEKVDADRGDALIAFGWASADDLLKLS